MADIQLTDGNDDYTQPEADRNQYNTVYANRGDDIVRVYSGNVYAGRGNDRIEKIGGEANRNSVGVAYWDSPGAEVNLTEGWALDGFGGRDTLIGVDTVSGSSGNDKITGNDNGNLFTPQDGHDVMDGRGGVDSVHMWVLGGSRLARLDELIVRVSADGRRAEVTMVGSSTLSLSLLDIEILHVMLPTGVRGDVLVADFITMQSLAEDAIMAGGTMRWNAAQPMGTATTLSYSFVTQDGRAGFRAFNAAEQQAVRDILAHTASIAGLTFTEVSEAAGASGQLRFGVNQQAGSKGQAALPGTQGDAAGDVWMDVESMVGGLARGSEGFAALLHEIGHALGLRHPRNTDPGENWAAQLRVADDRPGLTVMSSQASADGLFRADWGVLDIIALRVLYGTKAANTGHDSYVLGASEGLAAHTLVDDGGHDVIDASGIASGVRIDLVPGHLGSAGITSAGFAGVENLGIADGSWIEDAIGSPFDDVLVGNERANRLTGGLGNDWIDGGAGVDTAVFAGPRADYLLSNAFGKLYIEARDGTSGFDTLIGIEQVVFQDQTVMLMASAVGSDTAFSVDEDASTRVSLPDPADLTRAQVVYRLAAQPAHGTAQLTADGQLSYTPHPDFHGRDAVVYEITTGSGANAAVNRYQAFVEVNPFNDGPPVGRDMLQLVAGGATVRGRLPAAVDPDGDAVSYTATAGASHGEFLVETDGSFRYVAETGYQGIDRIAYLVSDGLGGTGTYYVNFSVVPVSRVREGTTASETLTGNASAEGLLAGAGNDRIVGNGGNDVIDGDAGIDTAVYAATRAALEIRRTDFGWTVRDTAGSEGTDSLTRVERLVFANGALALDLDGHAGTVAQIIRALFGPALLTNASFVGIGLSLADGGMAYADLVGLAIATPNFAALAGGRSNAQFVELVYRNVVGQAPSAGELAGYVGLIESGAFTQTSLAVLAAQHPINTASVELVGLVDTGIGFASQGG